MMARNLMTFIAPAVTYTVDGDPRPHRLMRAVKIDGSNIVRFAGPYVVPGMGPGAPDVPTFVNGINVDQDMKLDPRHQLGIEISGHILVSVASLFPAHMLQQLQLLLAPCVGCACAGCSEPYIALSLAMQPEVDMPPTPLPQKDHVLQQGMQLFEGENERGNVLKPPASAGMHQATAYHLQYADMQFEKLKLAPWTQVIVEMGAWTEDGNTVYGLLHTCGLEVATLYEDGEEVKIKWERLTLTDDDVELIKTFEVDGMLTWFEVEAGKCVARYPTVLEVLAEVRAEHVRRRGVFYRPLLVCQVLLTAAEDKALIPAQTVKVAGVDYVLATKELEDRYQACLAAFVRERNGERQESI